MPPVERPGSSPLARNPQSTHPPDQAIPDPALGAAQRPLGRAPKGHPDKNHSNEIPRTTLRFFQFNTPSHAHTMPSIFNLGVGFA